MFAEKLSNPFLKPSPFLFGNSQATNSYNPPLPPTSRYNTFSNNSYQQPKLSNYPNFQSTNYQNIDAPYSSKPREPGNIGQILINNPFNRSSNGLFSNSTSNADKSPNKYSSNWNTNISSKPAFYGNNNTHSNYSKNYQIGIPERQSNFYTTKISQEKPIIQRKFDNYLSGSSADSAATYINKIYELDADKSVDNANNPISNPFFRKSLIPEHIEEKQAKHKNSYDSAALKYSYQSEQKLDKPLYQNKYAQQSYQNYDFQSKNPQPVQNPQHRNYQQKLDNYDYEKLIGINEIDKQYDFSKYEKKENKYSSNTEINKIQQESKYKKYYEGLVEDDTYHVPAQNNQKQKIFNEGQDKYGYLKYQDQLNKYNPKYDDPLEKNTKYDFNEEDDFQKHNQYSVKSTEVVKNPYDRQILFDKKGSQKDIAKPSHKINDRVSFQEESNQSQKHPSYGEHQGPFQTLGKMNKNSTSWDHKEETYKFKQSEVQQYQYPKQIQDKVKNNKYQDYQNRLKQEKDKPKSQNKIINFSENESDESEPPVKEATSQKFTEDYPPILEIGGLRFYRIEID